MTFHNTMAEIGLNMNHTYGFLGVQSVWHESGDAFATDASPHVLVESL